MDVWKSTTAVSVYCVQVYVCSGKEEKQRGPSGGAKNWLVMDGFPSLAVNSKAASQLDPWTKDEHVHLPSNLGL